MKIHERNCAVNRRHEGPTDLAGTDYTRRDDAAET
jgi:hypothetical protein